MNQCLAMHQLPDCVCQTEEPLKVPSKITLKFTQSALSLSFVFVSFAKTNGFELELKLELEAQLQPELEPELEPKPGRNCTQRLSIRHRSAVACCSLF